MIENRVTFVTFLLGFDLSQKRINTDRLGKGRVGMARMLRGSLQFDYGFHRGRGTVFEIGASLPRGAPFKSKVFFITQRT